MNKYVGLILIAMIFLLPTLASAGKIYKWVDEKGTIHFSDTPRFIPKNSTVYDFKNKKADEACCSQAKEEHKKKPTDHIAEAEYDKRLSSWLSRLHRSTLRNSGLADSHAIRLLQESTPQEVYQYRQLWNVLEKVETITQFEKVFNEIVASTNMNRGRRERVSNMEPIIRRKRATTYHRAGNMIYGSDGTACNKVGNSLYCN